MTAQAERVVERAAAASMETTVVAMEADRLEEDVAVEAVVGAEELVAWEVTAAVVAV